MVEEQTKQLINIMKIKQTIKKAHDMAKEKGFWEGENRNIPQALLLVISEVSEATEALRKDHFADKAVANDLLHDLRVAEVDEEFTYNPEDWKRMFEESIKSSFEDEIADVAIRLFDLCGGMNIDLEKHIELKMKYNSMRGYKHGKKF
jgi:NTP pyrophosphatase (non-canonical NTP hydrolase)